MINTQRNTARVYNLEILPQCTTKDAATVETNLTLIDLIVLQKEKCAKYVVNLITSQKSVVPAVRKLSMQ